MRECHAEVTEALRAIGDPTHGKAVQEDRGSRLPHLGVPFPKLRQRVRKGFSFSSLPDAQVLEIWDGLWRTSPYGDVLFAALEFYAPIIRTRAGPGLWPVVREWSARVDNWCHSDALSALYSRILEARPREVYPTLKTWNRSPGEWLRRISLVSLIHYSGKKAVFLPPQRVLPLVTACLDDPRHYVQTAVGWVLREMWAVYPRDIASYLEMHTARLGPQAFARAIERRTPSEKARLREIRKLERNG